MPLIISLFFGVPLGFAVGSIQSRSARYMALTIAILLPLLFIFVIAMLFSQGRFTGYENLNFAAAISLFRFVAPWGAVLLIAYFLLGRPRRKRQEAEQDGYIP